LGTSVFLCFSIDGMRTRRVRRSRRKAASGFSNCEVSSTNKMSQPLAAVDSLENAEYPVRFQVIFKSEKYL